MRIVIAGAGDVGFHLVKLLAMEGHRATIIDIDDAKLDYISKHLDVHTIVGSSTSFKILQEAEVEKAELFIAVTSSEEVNFTTAVIAKQLGAAKTIVRVSNNEFLMARKDNFIKKIGIDEVILPEILAAQEIKRLIKQSAFTDFFSFERGALSLLGIKVTSKSKLIGKCMNEACSDGANTLIRNVAVLRNNETIIPDGQMLLKENDNVYFIAKAGGEHTVLGFNGEEHLDIKNIMVLGGTRVGYHAARMLSKKYNVKLIEPSKAKCVKIAERLPDVLVIHGDEHDIDLLEEEDLSRMDALIAVTENSETNIISCLMGKKHGVKKTISLVENMDFVPISQSVGVDTIINKRLIAANFIFRDIRRGEVLAMAGLHGAECEVLEFEVQKHYRICHKSIHRLKLPKGAIIGGVVRGAEAIIPTDEFVFADKDHVVILAKPDSIGKVEKLFS